MNCQTTSAQAATVERWTMATHDIDVYASGQSGWHLECDMLSAGRFAGSFDHVQLPGLRLVREITNRALRQYGEMNPDCYGFALTCQQDGEARFSGQRLNSESVMLGCCDELDLCSPAGFELLGIAVDGALLRSLAEQWDNHDLPDWLRRRVVLQLDGTTVSALRETLLRAYQAMGAMPDLLTDLTAVTQLRDEVLSAWLNTLPEDVNRRELRSTDARRRVVTRACELMMERPDEPLSMLEVCHRIGASQRKLRYCFEEVLGLSPARYLRALRLNGARRALKRAEFQSVQDIAAHWGFWHLSQFATDYRRQFGELPSQTLRSAAVSRR